MFCKFNSELLLFFGLAPGHMLELLLRMVPVLRLICVILVKENDGENDKRQVFRI